MNEHTDPSAAAAAQEAQTWEVYLHSLLAGKTADNVIRVELRNVLEYEDAPPFSTYYPSEFRTRNGMLWYIHKVVADRLHDDEQTTIWVMYDVGERGGITRSSFLAKPRVKERQR